MNDPIDELIDATDEADDSSPPEAQAGADGDRRAEAVAAEYPAPPAPQAEAGPSPSLEVAAAWPPRPTRSCAREEREPADVGARRRPRSLRQLQVRREPSGKVIIEAPAEAAGELGALFEGMAALLQSIGRQ